MILGWIDQAQASGARLRLACKEVGLAPITIRRWRQRPEGGDDMRDGPKTTPANKLSDTQRRRVLEVANSKDQRWFVVWAENFMDSSQYWNGKVHSRWLAFDGTLQSSAQNVGYCERGDPTQSQCYGSQPPGRVAPSPEAGTRVVGAIAAMIGTRPNPDATFAPKPDAGISDEGGGTRANDYCLCKGFFVGASHQWYTWLDTDAVRVHQYGWQAALTGSGYVGARYCKYPGACWNRLEPPCSVWCPLDRLPPTDDHPGMSYQLAHARPRE